MINTEDKLKDETPHFAKPVLYAGAVDKARISIYNEDCLQALKAMADNQFDLAIVDPPYGIGMDGTIGIGIGKEKGFTRKKEYTKKNWDKEVPSQEYFDELFRVSKNQIVWGANYFTKQLPVIKNYIFWHKKGQSVDDKFNDGESIKHTRLWWYVNKKQINSNLWQREI
jgi:DNA modification methylase